MRKSLMPSIEIFFLCKGGWSGGEPGKGGEQKIAKNVPACGDKVTDEASNKDELKMALLRGNTAKNQKSRKSQRDLDVEAGSATIRAEGPKADRVEGEAEGDAG